MVAMWLDLSPKILSARPNQDEQPRSRTQDNAPIPGYKPGKQDENGDVWPYLPDNPERVAKSRSSNGHGAE
jgi:hypothetical protein